MGYKDPTFAVNNFNKPKVLSSMETYVKNILVLLFGKPGFYPSLPSIGMDISQYLYKFEDEINTDEIKSKLIRQCRDFLPEVESGDFEIYKTTHNGHTVLIFQLPIINDTNQNSVSIGITTNNKGELVYNFVENRTQSI